MGDPLETRVAVLGRVHQQDVLERNQAQPNSLAAPQASDNLRSYHA